MYSGVQIPILLHIDPRSGMLGFPEDWPERRYNACNEPCDMLVGPCCCGATHRVTEDWVVELLAKKNAAIAPLEPYSVEPHAVEPHAVSPTPATMNRFNRDGEYLLSLVKYLQEVAREPVSLTLGIGSFGLDVRVSSTYLLPEIAITTCVSYDDVKESRLDLVRLNADRSACVIKDERRRLFKIKDLLR